MSEKFCLKWNDSQINWTKSLSDLRNDKESADVTLISDDKVKLSAHKILLSSCSNVFKFILKGSSHANPLLYLSGISSVNLGYLLDYIYFGEVNLFQDQLDSFLDSAQKLEIEGLLGSNLNHDLKVEKESHMFNQQNDEQNQYEPNYPNEDKTIVNVSENAPAKSRQYNKSFRGDVAKFDVSSLTPEEVDYKIKELYQKNEGVWNCLACDHSAADGGNMRKHVEIHLDGLSFSCTRCNKEFRSRKMLHNHTMRIHK